MCAAGLAVGVRGIVEAGEKHPAQLVVELEVDIAGDPQAAGVPEGAFQRYGDGSAADLARHGLESFSAVQRHGAVDGSPGAADQQVLGEEPFEPAVGQTVGEQAPAGRRLHGVHVREGGRDRALDLVVVAERAAVDGAPGDELP